jgi:zinc/manganese transport system ATP-binding protein
MTLLAVSGLSVSLGGRPVLRDVSFPVASGEFVGLIGANGAGKTTLLRTILGLQRPTSGTVTRESVGPGGTRNRTRNPTRNRMGYLPQKVALDPDTPLRARDVVGLGLDGQRLGIPIGTRRRTAKIDGVMEAVGAAEFADARVGRLSGGQQQRVLLAHALVGDPDILVLDEPLANLDPGSTHDVVSLLATVCRTRGIAVLLTAHDMNPLLSVIDRVVYLAGGRAASGSVDEVVRSDVLTTLYGRPIEVIRTAGRLLVVAGEEDFAAC